MEENNILVSIICTAYNHEKHIRSALDGFVMQKTNFAFEALVHDDASTDGTADIIREYAEKYPDIIVPIIQTENQHSKGVKVTNEILLPMARGKYIAFCEGDDYWSDENKLQMQVDFLEANPDYIACAHKTVCRDCSGRNKDKLLGIIDGDCDIEFEDIIDKHYEMICPYHTSALVVHRKYATELPDFYNTAARYGFGDLPRAIWYTISGKIRLFSNVMSVYRFRSNPTAWSSTMRSTEKILRHSEGLVAMCQGVKEFVSPQRQNLLDNVIKKEEYKRLYQLNEFSKIHKPPYREIWKRERLYFKIIVIIREIFPAFYGFLRKIKGIVRRHK